MAEFPTTVEDVLAATQVLEDVEKKADCLTAEEAVAFRAAIEHVITVAKNAVRMLNQELLRMLDGRDAIEQDGRRYWVAPKTEKEVTDHDAVARAAVRVALEVVAEMEDIADHDDQMKAAAQAAVTIMRDLYVSPSIEVKKLQLDKYGITREVVEKQRGEKVVKDAPVNRIEP